MNNKDYVVKFGDGTYYSKNVSYRGVAINKATWLTHKDANRISNRLNQPSFQMQASIEKREDENDK